MSSDDTIIRYKRPVRKRVKELEIPPNVHTIEDLIQMAQTGKRYANINNEMLWKISAQLIELNEMIGMNSLKESIFYHVIYYLQNLFVDDEKDYLHTVIMGPPGTGKCLGKNTPVLMFDGSIKMVQDIVVGDRIMGDDSTAREILSICTGTQEMFRVSSLESNDEHDVYIVNKSHILSLYHTDTQEYRDVCVEDYLKDPNAYQGYRTAVRYEKHLPLTMDPYILGQSIMKHHIADGKVIVKSTQPIFQSYMEMCDYIRQVKPGEYHVEHDVLQRYIDQRYLNEDYIFYSTRDLRQMLGGMIDAYAQVNTDEQTAILRFTTETHALYFMTRKICHLLGLSYSCKIKQVQYNVFPTPTRIRPLQQHVVFYYLTIEKVFDYIPSMIYTEVYELNDFPLLKPLYDIHVQSIGDGVYYGFEIDGNHRFVLGNHVVTHNTSVAKIIGEMYKNMGILSADGVFKIAKREDFVAEYLGQTAIKTKKLLNSCKGGVLFIDEVYALGPGKKDQDSFSKEAIDTINVFLSENSDSFCCIIAGYEKDIRDCFFSVNQGLERRFQWIHHIEGYSSKEMAEMFIKMIYDIKWSKEESVTVSSVTELIDKHKHLFVSYGGDIENLVTKCKMAHAKRIINTKNPKKHVISMEDVQFAIELMTPHSLKLKETDITSFEHMYL